ncbi:MAG: 30S ribosomal protein S9 [Opitutales bacterium]
MTTLSASEASLVAVGRRKTATARVRMTRGSGQRTVNGKPFEQYFYSEQLVNTALSPLDVAEMRDQMDLFIRVDGGGPMGQASAVSLGIARSLLKLDPELRPQLKKNGLLRRDPRMKERKKPGQPGARKRFQFSKR